MSLQLSPSYKQIALVESLKMETMKTARKGRKKDGQDSQASQLAAKKLKYR